MFTQKAVRNIVTEIRNKKLSIKEAHQKLAQFPYEDLDFAKIDHHRQFRKGYPEAVYTPGKTHSQLIKIIQSFKRSGQTLILTRLEFEQWYDLNKKFETLSYSENGRLGYFGKIRKQKKGKPISIVTGGTGDLPVAEEAAVTLELIGKKTERVYDCGVAGLHRLIDQLPILNESRAIICIAGMEGALASVVGGLVSCPVIAVPTSVGYGASFKGLSALLTMINSCAQGVAVVNIDNGFGAACFAASIK